MAAGDGESAAEWGHEGAVARRQPKTKIVCTLGPASRSVEMISRLLRTGMCVVRFNFSHGSHEYHQETLNNLRAAMELTGILCAVMLDTKDEPSWKPNLHPIFCSFLVFTLAWASNFVHLKSLCHNLVQGITISAWRTQ